MITFLLVVFGIVSNAAASVLIKYAMMPERKVSISDPLSIILNIPLWAGLLLYGIAFVLYALTLQRLPLNVTHPVLTCGAISMVAVLSVILFGESFTTTKIIGVVLVAIGVILISCSSSNYLISYSSNYLI